MRATHKTRRTKIGEKEEKMAKHICMSYENVQRTSEPSESTQEESTQEDSACLVRPRKAAKRGSIELAERIRDDTLERREARRVEGTTGVVVVVVVVREACRVCRGKNKNVFVAIATVT